MRRWIGRIHIGQVAADEDSVIRYPFGAAGETARNRDRPAHFLLGVANQRQAAVAFAINRARLLLGHILDRQGQLAGIAIDLQLPARSIEGMPDVVVRVHKGQRAGGEGAWILLGDQHPVQHAAGGQGAARKEETLAAGADNGGDHEHKTEDGHEVQGTSLLQNLRTSPDAWLFDNLAGNPKYIRALAAICWTQRLPPGEVLSRTFPPDTMNQDDRVDEPPGAAIQRANRPL